MDPDAPFQFLVFATQQDAAGWRRAEALTRKLPNARLINRMTSKVSELVLVARYGVVEPACVVITDEAGVRARLTHLPSADTLLRLAGQMGYPHS